MNTYDAPFEEPADTRHSLAGRILLALGRVALAIPIAVAIFLLSLAVGLLRLPLKLAACGAILGGAMFYSQGDYRDVAQCGFLFIMLCVVLVAMSEFRARFMPDG